MVISNSNPLFIATEHRSYGAREHSQILFKDEGHEIILKFNILEQQPTPQPASDTLPKNQSEPRSESQLGLQSKPKMQPLPEAQPGPQPKPKTHSETHTLVHYAAEDVVEIKSIRDRLGSSLIYLERVLSLGDIVKDVSHFIQNRTANLHPLDPSYNWDLNWNTV